MTNSNYLTAAYSIGMMALLTNRWHVGFLTLAAFCSHAAPPLPCLDNHRYMDGNRLTSLEVGLFDNNPKLWLVYVDQGIDGV